MKIFSLKLWQLTLVLLISSAYLSSCGDDDIDPEIEMLGFVDIPGSLLGTYEGILVFDAANGDNTTTQEGKATLKRSGSTYTIDFSNDIPSITNRKFIEGKESGTYLSLQSIDSPDGIIIEDGELVVDYKNDDGRWQFVGEY